MEKFISKPIPSSSTCIGHSCPICSYAWQDTWLICKNHKHPELSMSVSSCRNTVCIIYIFALLSPAERVNDAALTSNYTYLTKSCVYTRRTWSPGLYLCDMRMPLIWRGVMRKRGSRRESDIESLSESFPHEVSIGIASSANDFLNESYLGHSTHEFFKSKWHAFSFFMCNTVMNRGTWSRVIV